MSSKRSAHHTFIERHGVPEGWKNHRLRDLARLVGGGTPDLSDASFWDGTIPWLTPTEMTRIKGRFAVDSDRKITDAALAASACELLPIGSLVLSTRGTIGNIVIAGVPLTCNQSCEALVPSDCVTSDYLYYLLCYARPIIERFGAGTTFSSVTRRDIRDIHFAVPRTIEEQSAISSLLTQTDDTLAAAETKLAAARRLKTALMQQLFTRGIPGRHTHFKTTQIGEIPAEWNVVPLGTLATAISGIALNADRAPKSTPYQYLTVMHVQRERLRLDDVRHMEVFPNELPDALIEAGDILVVEGHANTSEIGRAAIATEEVAGFAYQNHLFRVRLKPGATVNRQFLLGALNSERIRRHWNSTCATSSGLNTINHRGLRRLLIQEPRVDEQNQIAKLLRAANDNIEACESELIALQNMKRSLMQNLLTGRVRVRN